METNMKVTPLLANDYESAERWAIFHSENGEQMSSAVLTTADSRYSGGFLPALLVGGVATQPEYRRFGCVRRILESAFEQAPERGWAVSLLHPFHSPITGNSDMKRSPTTGCWNSP